MPLFNDASLRAGSVPPSSAKQLPAWYAQSKQATGDDSDIAGDVIDVEAALSKTAGAYARESASVAAKVRFVPRSTLALLGQAYAIPVAPYRTLREWLAAQRLRAALATMPPVLPDDAPAKAEKVADQVEQQLGQAVDRAWQDSRFDERAAGALQAGAVMAEQLGETFGAFGPVGQAVGYAVGFVAGLITGILPLAAWDVMNRWTSLVEAFTPVERYLLWSRLDKLVDAGRGKIGKSPLPPGLLREPGLFYTAWGGPDAITLFCAEILSRYDWCPDGGPPAQGGLSEQSQLSLYAMCVVAAHAGDDEKWLTGKAGDELKSGKGPAWLRPYAVRYPEVKAGEVRRVARIAGIPDLDPAPMPAEILAALEQAQQEIAARQAAAEQERRDG